LPPILSRTFVKEGSFSVRARANFGQFFLRRRACLVLIFHFSDHASKFAEVISATFWLLFFTSLGNAKFWNELFGKM
jgi:hypothetical protein